MFDFEFVKRGCKVETNSGGEVKDLTKFECTPPTLVGIVDGKIGRWNMKGLNMDSFHTKLDLTMTPLCVIDCKEVYPDVEMFYNNAPGSFLNKEEKVTVYSVSAFKDCLVVLDSKGVKNSVLIKCLSFTSKAKVKKYRWIVEYIGTDEYFLNPTRFWLTENLYATAEEVTKDSINQYWNPKYPVLETETLV